MEKPVENTKAKPGKKRRRHIFRKILVILLVLVLLVGAGFYAVERLKAEYTVTYEGYTASVGTISNALSFSGSLQLIDSATYTAASSASVREVYVREGDAVAEGDRLMRLTNGQTVTAEFDGRVNQVTAEKDQKVSAGAELIQVADFSRMKVTFRVDEYDINDVQVGDICRVTATATEKTFDSSLASINYISSSGGSVAYYTATAYVEVGEGIYPGMQVTVTIPQEEAKDVVVLKMDALSFDETNRAFVYMQQQEGEEMEKVYVETGVSNGNYVEIRNGLQAEDRVYAVAEQETVSTMAGLLSGLFGGQRVMNGGGERNRQFNWDDAQRSMPDFSNGGSMPGFGGGGGK